MKVELWFCISDEENISIETHLGIGSESTGTKLYIEKSEHLITTIKEKLFIEFKKEEKDLRWSEKKVIKV